MVHLGAICAVSGVGGIFFSICRKGEKVLGWLRKWGRLLLSGLVALGIPVLLCKGKLQGSVMEPQGDALGTGHLGGKGGGHVPSLMLLVLGHQLGLLGLA